MLIPASPSGLAPWPFHERRLQFPHVSGGGNWGRFLQHSPHALTEENDMTIMTPAEALSRAVAREVGIGARVESRTEYQAVLVHGRRPNHALHAVLTLLTLGWWAIVWGLVALCVRETRLVLAVDPQGLVWATYHPASATPQAYRGRAAGPVTREINGGAS